jgi:hypothetical protein
MHELSHRTSAKRMADVRAALRQTYTAVAPEAM